MTLLLVAGLLFGLVHPGCKWITSSGLDLLPFCLLFVISRVLFQLPVVIKSGARVGGWNHWKFLIALGFVGAGLRITEFLGIVEGLPVSLVSFLIYLHPVWTIFFSRWLNGEPVNGLKVFKIGAALVGTALLCDLSSIQNVSHILALWSPITAGVLIALWICLSTRAQHDGTTVVAVAFYYDLFTLVPLVALCALNLDASHWHQTVQWLSDPTNLLTLCIYSLFTGVFPNYAFYIGLTRSTAMTAALLMLFEPIASSLIAVRVWNEPISSSFYWGAILVLLINLPDAIFLMVRDHFRRRRVSLIESNASTSVTKALTVNQKL